jgi:hypothetical protein
LRALILQDIPVGQPEEKFCIARCLERAFVRAGYENTSSMDTRGIDTAGNIRSVMKNYDTLIITQNYFLETIEYVNEFSGLKLFWSIDSHKDFERHVEFANAAGIEIVLVSGYAYVDKFSSRGLNVVWFPNCYPSDLIKPVCFSGRPIHLGFCGSKGNRGPDLNRMSEKLNMFIAFDAYAEKMVNTICSFEIGWNKNESDDLNFRTFELLGAGCLTITNETPGIKKLFDVDGAAELCVYNDIDTCIQKISSLDSGRIRETALRGYKNARMNHTYDARVTDLIQMIEMRKT